MKILQRKKFNMIKEEPVLLITASILPQEKNYIKLRNAKQRLEQYINSIKFYIKHTKIKKIVFCDNSNYRFDTKEIFLLAEKYEKTVEIIHFLGDCEKIAERGKGYGEGEIIKYALKNSNLLEKAYAFIKVTGRIKILNIDDIKNSININKIYFNKSIIEYQAIDTVIFCMPKREYAKYFMNVYKKVYDKRGIYIEHVIANTILRNRIKYYNIPFYPVIKGIRGTTKTPYQQNMELEKKVYQGLSRFNLFNVNWIYPIIFSLYDEKSRKGGK